MQQVTKNVRESYLTCKFVLSRGTLNVCCYAYYLERNHQKKENRSEENLKAVCLGWGGRIRTYGTRYQKPMPYHLATPHQRVWRGK